MVLEKPRLGCDHFSRNHNNNVLIWLVRIFRLPFSDFRKRHLHNQGLCVGCFLRGCGWLIAQFCFLQSCCCSSWVCLDGMEESIFPFVCKITSFPFPSWNQRFHSLFHHPTPWSTPFVLLNHSSGSSSPFILSGTKPLTVSLSSSQAPFLLFPPFDASSNWLSKGRHSSFLHLPPIFIISSCSTLYMYWQRR